MMEDDYFWILKRVQDDSVGVLYLYKKQFFEGNRLVQLSLYSLNLSS